MTDYWLCSGQGYYKWNTLVTTGLENAGGAVFCRRWFHYYLNLQKLSD